FFLEAAHSSVAGFACLTLYVLDDTAAFVEIRQNACAADLREFSGLGLDGLLGFLFEVMEVKVFKNELRDLVYVDLGFVIFLARLIARTGPLSRPLTRLAFARDHVSHFALAVAGADMLSLAVVVSKLVFVEGADGNFDDA